MTLAGSRWHGLEQALYNFPPGMRQAYSEERGPVGVPVTADVALFQYNESMMQNAGLPPLSRLGEDVDVARHDRSRAPGLRA